MNDIPRLKPEDMVRQVVATMAVEDMYLPDDFIKKLEKIAAGEVSSVDVIQEVITEYAR